MYMLIRLIPLRQLLLEQLPALAFSLVIAEMFYKFHSFTLECVAFLLTWYAVDGVCQLLRRLLPSNTGKTRSTSSRTD
jgi:hypothetical protein